MQPILKLLGEELEQAFESCGYEKRYAVCSVSNRPDLCEYQCNGAMAAAKTYHKAPLDIATEIVSALSDSAIFSQADAVRPGFINLKVSGAFLASYMMGMNADPRHGCDESPEKKRILIDYGGPNVAKPLHVGHLRSAIIGESVKRICRFMGHDVIGDIHLGDWGLQIGLIITELYERGLENTEFTIGQLEEIYPAASARSKEDEAYHERALEATKKLQEGDETYRALWKRIMEVSVADMKKNYDRLNVSFDWWKGESDAQPYIPTLVSYLKDNGYARYDDGALVVDVKESTDTKEIPPCMILKSNGSALYQTTDLATMMQRREDFDPDHMIYVVDKRQGLHFQQIFRCAKKTGLLEERVRLDHIGFGTMNGKDGKPFKTRAGGVMRLEGLISEINEEMLAKIKDNPNIDQSEAEETAKIVGLSAIKYGDLSNQATKDYVFDMDRFTSFEGETGPYLLYTIVRIKSILRKYEETNQDADLFNCILMPANASEKALMMELANFNAMITMAYEEIAPHKVCAYLYALANAFNRFYHETRILTEEEEMQKGSWISLLTLTLDVMECCIDLLGFESPERM